METQKNEHAKKRRRRPARVLSFLLTVTLLASSGGFTSLAQTISGSQTDGRQDGGGAGLLPESELPEVAEPGTAIDAEALDAAKETTPANPEHSCTKDEDGTGVTDLTRWDYIYFGSYPQSEVTDEETIEVIDRAIPTDGVCGSAGVDVWVGSVRYRRISQGDTHQGDNFGGDSYYRYFRWEPIRWKVLSADSESLFVAADKGLDDRSYNEGYGEVSWEDSTLRSWLNDGFFTEAFSSKEQGAIIPYTVSGNGLLAGVDEVSDKVSLLTDEQAVNPAYGFCDNQYLTASRWVQASAYSYVRGTKYPDYRTRENCEWWLRSKESSSGFVPCTKANGMLFGESLFMSGISVVPVLHLKAGSDAWSQSAEEVRGNGPEKANDALAFNPTAPAHHCAKDTDASGETDTSDWDYVYFGSYPQSEVTNALLITEIEKAVEATDKSAENIVDVWVNGTRYRRLAKAGTVYDGYFGDEADYRYFRWEKIRWKVLSNDGETFLLVADQGLDCERYNNVQEDVEVTWAGSTLREWLKEDFFKAAFNVSEQSVIVEQEITNEPNPGYSYVDAGEGTKDRVFLLSVQEEENQEYGFCQPNPVDQDESSAVTTASATRRVQASDYSHAKGAGERTEDDTKYCYYWLRSPGGIEYKAATVIPAGSINQDGAEAYQDKYAVVPAVRIRANYHIWSKTKDPDLSNGAKDDTGRQELTPANPVHYCGGDTDSSDYTQWDTIYFGSYPQSEVTNEALIAKIESAVSAEGTGAAAVVDVSVNGVKYRRVERRSIEGEENSDEGADYYYFQWRKIRWRVLSNDGSSDLFLAAANGLDYKQYHTALTDITWKDSALRNWLNNEFYQTAFGSEEQSAIVAQTVSNNDNSYSGTAGGGDTVDKVYLLSFEEATNPFYGFCQEHLSKSAGRWAPASDYASVMGGFMSRDAAPRYWLRSPGEYADHAGSSGDFTISVGTSVDEYHAVVPVLHINSLSEVWSKTDDTAVSGDDGGDESGSGTGGSGTDGGSTGTGGTDGGSTGTGGTDGGTAGTGGSGTDGSSTGTGGSGTDGSSTGTGGSGTDGSSTGTGGSGTDGGSTGTGGSGTDGGSTGTSGSGTGGTGTDGTPQTQVKVQKITISGPSRQLAAGKKVQLSVTVTPSDAANKSVTWKSGNTKYAQVSQTGKLTLKKAGAGKTVTVTATAADGSGVSASYKVKIMSGAVKSVKLTVPAASRSGDVTVSKNGKTVKLKTGKSVTLKAQVTTTGKKVNKTLLWESSNTKYATVTKTGKVTAKKAGKGKSVTITATSTDGTNKKAKIKLQIQ